MRRLLLTAMAALMAVAAYSQTHIKVEVHNVVALEEQFNVTFIIEGEDKPSDFSWSPGEDFQLLWGPQQGHSTSISIMNGKRTKSVQTTYIYVLRAVRAGKFELPKANAQVKGQAISSSAVVIEVVAEGKASSSQSQNAPQTGRQSQQRQQLHAGVTDDDIFLTLTLNRTEVVTGEPIIATIKLYQRVNVSGFESANFPSFNGFWSQELEAPTNIEFTRETYDGQIYNAALLRKFVLIPQQQGKITIDPAELICLVNIRVSSGGATIFDGFFDDYRTIRKKVTSKPVTVTVSPLPSGAPSSFGGGVGQFSISAKVSNDSLKTHEAASLTVTISGRGNISLLEPPKVNFPPDMEVYDTKVSDKIDKGGLSGSKYYEYPFIPRSHGDFVIEPVKYTYYDVDQKKYVTLETAPIPVSVAKGNDTYTESVAIAGVNRNDVRNLGSDIRFITTKTPRFMQKGHFFVGSSLFYGIAVFLVIAALLAFAVLRRVAAMKTDVAGSKNRKATKMALKRLKLAGTFLKQNLYTAFYEELHKALLGFISDKLNMPVSELSREKISEALKEGNVADEYIDTFIGILDACEFARYSPDSGHDAMAAHYDEAVNVISSIDSNMKAKKTMNKTAMILVMMLLMPFALSAQSDDYPDSLWNAANQAYTEGRWGDAIRDYEMISSIGMESAALYCNTGDAYFKDGNMPMAILYYERALKADLSYDDARYNLELLYGMIQDRIDPVPEFILKTWAEDICYMTDSDSWAVAFIVFFGLTLALIIVFLLSPSVAGRRTGFFAAIVTILLASASLTFSIWQKRNYMNADDAIVMSPVTSVKSSPSAESSKDLFILHEGTKVRIIDKVGSWNNISLADGRQGWIPSEDITAI